MLLVKNRILVAVVFTSTAPDVNVRSSYEFGLVPEFPYDDEKHENRNENVVDDEIRGAEWDQEGRVS